MKFNAAFLSISTVKNGENFKVIEFSIAFFLGFIIFSINFY
jgi:hypothetical protein